MIKPKFIDKVTFVFPASVKDLLPAMAKIPEEFHSDNNQWNKLAGSIFYGFKRDLYLTVNPKIDSQLAWRHITTCLKSFEPKHEHKIAGVGYLLSLWFISFNFGDGEPDKPLVHFQRQIITLSFEHLIS